jgi:hypothetical protein
MWSFLKKILARSDTLNALLGDVVFTTPSQRGVSKHSIFEWCVKKTVDGDRLFVSAKMIPDGYAGPEGSPTNYISFDLDAAIQLRDNLNSCIEIVQRQSKTDGQPSFVRPS